MFSTTAESGDNVLVGVIVITVVLITVTIMSMIPIYIIVLRKKYSERKGTY